MSSSMIFNSCTSKQATQTWCSWSAHSCGNESVLWLWFWLWEEGWPREESAKTCLECNGTLMVMYKQSLQAWSKVRLERSIEILIILVVWSPGGGLFIPHTNQCECKKGRCLRHYIVYVGEKCCFSQVCASQNAIKFLWSKWRCARGGPKV